MNVLKRTVSGIALSASIFLPIVGHAALSSSPAEIKYGSVPHERLFELDRRGSKVVAVGDRGLVLRSEDGGAEWTREVVPGAAAIFGVALVGETTIAVGGQGSIYVHSAGAGWKKVETGTKERLLNVAGNKDGLAFAVGAFGTVLRSDDFGQTWRNGAPDWRCVGDVNAGGGSLSGAAGEPTMFAVQVFDNGTVFIGGELGFILRSLDGGSNWQMVNQAIASVDTIAATVNAVRVRDDGVGFAVGQAGLLLKTEDLGATWTPVQAPTTGNLNSVDSLSNGSVIAVGMRTAVRSDDDGRTWTEMRDFDFHLNWYSGVSADVGTGDVLAVGHSARIVRLGAR